MQEQIRPTSELKETEPKFEISLVIPTKNESGNVDLLFERLVPILTGYKSEAIFVDDSSDDTAEKIKGKVWPFPVNIIQRGFNEQVGGLSTAVLEGVAKANGKYIGVMDADLQHPPELLPQLINSAIRNNDDIVIASRFIPGGSIEGLSNPIRKLGSRGTTMLTHVLFPELKQVSDPMSGFFLFNKKILEGDFELNPQGFKILLELLVKTNWVSLGEIPLRFNKRTQEKSKFIAKEKMSAYFHIFQLFREIHGGKH